MVLDYNEKKPTQKIAERKPVQRNKPSRRQPAGMLFLVGGAVLLVAYGAGFVSGRYLFPPRTPAPVVAAAQPAVKKDLPAPAPAPLPPGEPSLTFYRTLPAGNKAVIGSGINPKKPEAAAPKGPQVALPAQAPAPAEPAAATAAPAADGEKAQGARSYVVQVASYRDKAEAEGTREKLATKGLAAYLSESKSADKGLWYRLRVGKHLSKEEADELAAKVGKGAVVLPE